MLSACSLALSPSLHIQLSLPTRILLLLLLFTPIAARSVGSLIAFVAEPSDSEASAFSGLPNSRLFPSSRLRTVSDFRMRLNAPEHIRECVQTGPNGFEKVQIQPKPSQKCGLLENYQKHQTIRNKTDVVYRKALSLHKLLD